MTYGSSMNGANATRLMLPMEWIDRIFDRLNDIYNGRWLSSFPTRDIIEIEKYRWQTQLADLTPDQIKRALDMCKRDPHHMVNVYDFAKFARGDQYYFSAKKFDDVKKSDPATARKHLAEMAQKLYGKYDADSTR